MMPINCPHFDRCAGCSRNDTLERPLAYVEACLAFKEQGIHSLKLHLGSSTAWRCRSKLAVRGTFSHPHVGLFEENSHRVVDIPFCRVHHPRINEAVNFFKEWISQNKISLYNEVTHTGLVRYIQMTLERQTQRVQLVLVLNNVDTNEKEKIEALWKSHALFWHSIWINHNTRKDNVIIGSEWELLFGEKWLWESFQGHSICFHPASFIQGNPEMFEILLTRLKAFVPSQANLVEFYAGVGVIGMSLSQSCQRVQCVEAAPYAEQCFDESCKKLPTDIRQKLSFVSGSASAYASLLDQTIDLAIVDPPRKGIDPILMQHLCLAPALKRLIYISCGWSSFQRDCGLLTKKGWRLTHAEGFLFFPGTDQMELLAIFDKA